VVGTQLTSEWHDDDVRVCVYVCEKELSKVAEHQSIIEAPHLNTQQPPTMPHASQVRILVPGSHTVLGDAAADNELFLTDEVEEVLLSSVQGLAAAKQLQREFDSDLRTRHFKEDEELRQRNVAAKAAGKHVA